MAVSPVNNLDSLIHTPASVGLQEIESQSHQKENPKSSSVEKQIGQSEESETRSLLKALEGERDEKNNLRKSNLEKDAKIVELETALAIEQAKRIRVERSLAEERQTAISSITPLLKPQPCTQDTQIVEGQTRIERILINLKRAGLATAKWCKEHENLCIAGISLTGAIFAASFPPAAVPIALATAAAIPLFKWFISQF